MPLRAGVVFDLFCALNPSLKRRQLETICWPKLWAGFFLNNAGGCWHFSLLQLPEPAPEGPLVKMDPCNVGCTRCTRPAVVLLLPVAVIPLCIAYTFLTTHIDWSGIRYWRRGGKIVRVLHTYQK